MSAGYTGEISQLRAYVAQTRPRAATEPLVRFETEPGHQAQADFAEFTFPWGKRYALLVVLGYSRLLWLRFYQKQDMQTLFAGWMRRSPALAACRASFVYARDFVSDGPRSLRSARWEEGLLADPRAWWRSARVRSGKWVAPHT